MAVKVGCPSYGVLHPSLVYGFDCDAVWQSPRQEMGYSTCAVGMEYSPQDLWISEWVKLLAACRVDDLAASVCVCVWGVMYVKGDSKKRKGRQEPKRKRKFLKNEEMSGQSGWYKVCKEIQTGWQIMKTVTQLPPSMASCTNFWPTDRRCVNVHRSGQQGLLCICSIQSSEEMNSMELF